MRQIAPQDPADAAAIETREWQDSLDYVLQSGGAARVAEILSELEVHARRRGLKLPFTANTPYVNTIGVDEQTPVPGSNEIERRIKSLVRWNAMAMVVKANLASDGIGGHISTFASSATLYEVGFNHFFKGKGHKEGGDFVYFQGHASPGMYSRAFLEGRLSQQQLENFRRELKPGGGLSSYPHPWLMPDFWEAPTVSMGLGPIMSIYQARFSRYLEDRGLKPRTDQKVWAFLGDGETDEPEALGAISLASREKLDNLIFVINCNLQRLDGPVRGNGRIVQELEANFRGAGWNVIKVLWGREWDELFARDHEGLLRKRAGEVVDGEYQKYSVMPGAYIRQQFFGTDPRLLKMVEHLSDDQLKKMRVGGHDPEKVFHAYKAATEHKGQPTVILARTIKGYGLGESGEGKNITHQQKKMNEEEIRTFRTRFGIPISDDQIKEMPFYRPAESSPEITYMRERREALGGYLPSRQVKAPALKCEFGDLFEEFVKGTDGRTVSTTMVFVRMLAKMLRDDEIGKLVVPIVPDEARTFGMEALFRQVGIYSHIGQLYEPVDIDTLLYYKEAQNGQILEEGINEAGSMSSLIAAGTRLRDPRHQHDPVLHLLLDVRLPAHRRPDLGRRRHAREGLPARRHRRPHDARRRRPAAPGRPQPRDGADRADVQGLRSGLRLRAGGHHRGRPEADVSRSGRLLLLPDGDERAVRDAADAGRLEGRHPARPLQGPGRPRPRVRSCRRRSWAAARSWARSSRRSRSSARSTASPPTCGASPATPSCIATASTPSATTCCTPASRRRCRT